MSDELPDIGARQWDDTGISVARGACCKLWWERKLGNGGDSSRPQMHTCRAGLSIGVTMVCMQVSAQEWWKCRALHRPGGSSHHKFEPRAAIAYLSGRNSRIRLSNSMAGYRPGR